MHPQSWAYGAGWNEDAGRVSAPRPAERRGHQVDPEFPQGTLAGCPWPAQATVPGVAPGRVRRTPPGAESGACLQRGRAGTGERPRSPWHRPRTGGPGAPKPWGGAGPRPGQQPGRATTHEPRRTRYGDASATRSDRRGAVWQASRRSGPGQVGPCGPREPREGRQRRAARCAGRQDGSALALTTRHPPTPAPCGASRHDLARVWTTLAPLSATDVLREASQHTSQASAAGIDGVRRRRTPSPWTSTGATWTSAYAAAALRPHPSSAAGWRRTTGGSGPWDSQRARRNAWPQRGGDAAGRDRRARLLRRRVGLSARTQPP